MKPLHYISALSLLALTGCQAGTVKDTLGLSRSAPDEFRVVSRPPLSVPPDFTLRPPSASDVSPNQPTASEQAKSQLRGASAKPAAKKAASSSAESQFLKRAGAANADAGVRDKLVEEKIAVQDEEGGSWWDSLGSEPEKKEPMVNAKEESKRIQKNEAEGKPVTEGKTPEIKPRDRGILGDILGD